MEKPNGPEESTAADDDTELDGSCDEQAESPLAPGDDELADAWWAV
jgi:hypothetical protein